MKRSGLKNKKYVPSTEQRAENDCIYVDIKAFEQSIDRIFGSAKGFIPLRSAWFRLIPPN
jgi:hypothetical protein